MFQFITNVWRWLLGFTKLRGLRYKPGWNHWTFLPLYALDYGTRTLTGGACVSWSRWAYDHRFEYRSALLIDRFMNHVDEGHGKDAGPVLWGTVECSPKMQVSLAVIWLLTLVIWYGQ